MKVLEKAQIANLSEHDLMLYEESLKIYRDIYSAEEYSRNDERVAIAKKMILKHFETEVIMELTELSREEIEALRVSE